MTIEDFKKKYGTCGWRIMIETFIELAPQFNRDVEYAGVIGKMCADLESALEDVPMPPPDASYYGEDK